MGKCPKCYSRLPFRFKDRVQCQSCKSIVESDPRSSVTLSFVVAGAVFLTYPIDWRIALLTGLILGLAGLKKLKYRIVSGE